MLALWSSPLSLVPITRNDVLLEFSWTFPSGQAPVLVNAAVAVPDVELGAVGGGEVRVVEAFAGGGVDQGAVLGDPSLVAAAVAVPDVDQGAVGGGVGADDVEALAVDLEGVAAD